MAYLFGFHARANQVRRLSQNPFAILAKVFADNGAIKNNHHILNNSTWRTGSPLQFQRLHSSLSVNSITNGFISSLSYWLDSSWISG